MLGSLHDKEQQKELCNINLPTLIAFYETQNKEFIFSERELEESCFDSDLNSLIAEINFKAYQSERIFQSC